MATWYYLLNHTDQQYITLGKLCVTPEGIQYFSECCVSFLVEHFGRPCWDDFVSDSTADMNFLDLFTEVRPDAERQK